MNELFARPIRKFNPGTFQADKEVVRQFVVRKNPLNTVLEVLRGNISSALCQHLMIIAPRGQGKSMLLARVAAELRTNDDLSTNLLPVRFMEESQEIFNIADFWLETLFYLAKEMATREPDFSQELQRTHADLGKRWSERAIAEHVRSAVLSAADHLGRKLVLMVENMQTLSDDVDDDFGGQLRQILQSEPQIMLIATATSHFEGLGDATQPFFDLFRTIYLKPLQTEECRRLWQMVSGDAMNSRAIRPLEILTGGSPRLLVIVAGFARHRSLRWLLEELVTLIDEHTEYFRGHLEALPKSERRIYAALLDLWQPSSPKEVAKRARMDIRNASVMLGRLIKRGIVKTEGSGRRRWYSAVERLYSIYYHLRRERGDESGVVRNLMDFMTAFYKPSELASLLATIKEKEPEKWSGISEILRQMSPEADKQEMVAKADSKWRQAERAYEEKRFADAIDLIDEVLEILKALLALHDDPRQVLDHFAHICTLRAFAYASLRDDLETIKAYNDVLALERSDAPKSNYMQWAVAIALVNKGMAQNRMGSASAALQTCEVLEAGLEAFRDKERRHFEWCAINVRTTALLLQEDHQAAMQVFRSAYSGCDDEVALSGMLDLILNSIVAGASEHRLVEILTSDRKISAPLAPFILAMCERLGGERERGPSELQEVIADVHKRIESAVAENDLCVTLPEDSSV